MGLFKGYVVFIYGYLVFAYREDGFEGHGDPLSVNEHISVKEHYVSFEEPHISSKELCTYLFI